MPYIRKKLRNECIVYDREVLNLTYRELAAKYRIARSTACEVYRREKMRPEYFVKEQMSTPVEKPPLDSVRTSE